MVKNTLTDTVENETRADGGRHLNQLFSDLAQVTSREVGRAWVLLSPSEPSSFGPSRVRFLSFLIRSNSLSIQGLPS